MFWCKRKEIKELEERVTKLEDAVLGKRVGHSYCYGIRLHSLADKIKYLDDRVSDWEKDYGKLHGIVREVTDYVYREDETNAGKQEESGE